MKLQIFETYEEMSKMCATHIEETIQRKPDAVLGLATGGTPMKLYEHLIEGHQSRDVNYEDITTFNLDEYVGLPAEHPQSYHYYMWHHLFKHLNIQPAHTYIPNGLASNIEEECVRYEHLLSSKGPIDIILLGIGTNGHIGFNEPGTELDSMTHEVFLHESTRNDNARFFNSLQDVPTHAITIGIQSILKSKEIILLVSGENKAEALHRLLKGEPSIDFPASWLHLHNNVTVFADREAARLIGQSENY